MNNLLEQALRYSEWGEVFPLVSLEKHPLTPHAHKDSSQDRQQIEAWWKQHPQANIGLNLEKLPHVWVLDIDRKENGTDGLKSLQDIKCEDGQSVYEKISQLDNLKGCTTPSGGQHLYFTSENEEITTNRKYSVLPGIDVLGSGYAILPPSKTHKGEYRLSEYFTLDDIPPAPEWLEQAVLKAIHRPKAFTLSGRRSSNREMTYTAELLCKLLDGVSEGNRDNWLTEQCGRMLGLGVPPDYTYQWLNYINDHFTHPPLPGRDINRIFTSILKREEQKNESRYDINF
ncbi:hypothetical protein B5772_06975 [Dolosigranulum pigrum]|uniref:bifunctional DNA primase/polymerase n=1 Tax=Dolosigranulum pigrum TaxID=29394 RepID=UPI000DC4DC6A|nr:bifunctional DNA primase/polymerase [Dolosigranulum pigrum]QJS96663.1 hypothetical protein B5772_06975 [Dolosigranulum pigrum]